MVGRGPFKRQSLKVLVERQIPISTIIDIGVLSGTPELKEAFPKTRHILFEPVSEFHKKIRENYTGLDYRLIEAAVTDEDRDVTLDVTLHVRKAVSQTGITHSSVVDDASENSEPRIVTGTRLDTFTKANALVKPYLVKIDVDGNEMKILSRATETLKDASVVMIETPKGEFSEHIDNASRLNPATSAVWYR